MTTATATGSRARPPAAASPDEFRRALELTLAEADADERIGPLLSATGLRMRFEFTDSSTALNVAAGAGGQNLAWSFGDDPGWSPKLVLGMAEAVANRYLQGSESLAIAIVRWQVRLRGESRVALLYLPAARLLCEPYRRVVERDFPRLLVA
jgi:hypothetical protein